MSPAVNLSPGKARALQRLSDGHGRYALLAIDQRPPLFETAERAAPPGRKLSAKELVRRTAELKALLAETLCSDVTGLLVDPIYGFRAAMPVVPTRCALMLTLEHHVFKTDRAGFRTSSIIPKWDAVRAVRAGAEALKLLAWYHPEAPRAVRQKQLDFVRRVGAACRAVERPFIFEILTYPLPGESNEDYARKLPDRLMASAEAFADRKFGVDLYKMPLLAAASGVREWGGGLYDLGAIVKLMERMTRLLPAPWLLLSGGLTASRFTDALEASVAAGCRGYLAGRAVWAEPLAAYPDLATCRTRLLDEGRAALLRLNAIVARLPSAPPRADWRLPISQ